MRRRQEEGMADAPHTNPNPSSSHIEYVSEFYFISFRFVLIIFQPSPTLHTIHKQCALLLKQSDQRVTAMHLQIIKVQKFN